MRFHRPARRIALGLGAAGIALGSGGLAIAATALIQPAGALSVQVPAVAVREQNVNSAGRIRVALPKTSVGVNGSVSVNNLPENSAGALKVAPQSTGANAPDQYTTASGNNGGTYTVLPPPPSGETYHLGLVTIAVGCNIAYATGDTLATTGPSGGNISEVIVPQQGTAVLPFDGLVVGAGRGLSFSTNANSGSCWNVVVDFWLTPLS